MGKKKTPVILETHGEKVGSQRTHNRLPANCTRCWGEHLRSHHDQGVRAFDNKNSLQGQSQRSHASGGFHPS